MARQRVRSALYHRLMKLGLGLGYWGAGSGDINIIRTAAEIFL
jgi:hypothetical protein